MWRRAYHEAHLQEGLGGDELEAWAQGGRAAAGDILPAGDLVGHGRGSEVASGAAGASGDDGEDGDGEEQGPADCRAESGPGDAGDGFPLAAGGRVTAAIVRFA